MGETAAPKIDAAAKRKVPIRNQQVSVASLLALVIGVAAFALGYFPQTNIYSIPAGGMALLLASRATLYAWTGTVFARKLPVFALIFSILAMTFCILWPWHADDVKDAVAAWWSGTKNDATVPDTTAETTNDSAAEAKRKADQETYRLIKEQALKDKEKNGPAVKPPKAPE